MLSVARRWPWLVGTIIAVALMILASHGLEDSPLLSTIEDFSLSIGEGYNRWFVQRRLGGQPIVLLGLSFLGDVAASISPCILSMLPINLSYIGTCNITSRRDALVKALAFVLGVVLVLSLLGLFSGIAAIVLVGFKGYVQLAVGAIVIAMALSLAGWIRLPIPQAWLQGAPLPKPSQTWHDRISGPFCVGLTFALVSSPCTSPILIAVLAAGAASGSQLQSWLAMVCYALGYTTILFLASLFTGLVKQSRGLLVRSEAVMGLASFSLLAIGGFYVVSGGRWILAVWGQ
jgi:cytochrome c-type biogenesis protein